MRTEKGAVLGWAVPRLDHIEADLNRWNDQVVQLAKARSNEDTQTLPQRHTNSALETGQSEPDGADQAAQWIGALWVANLSSVAAWDQDHAVVFFDALKTRLQLATNRSFSVIDGDTLCVNFEADVEPATIEAELDSLAYILAQDVTENRQSLSPDIHVGVARSGSSKESPINISRRARGAACPRAMFGRDGAAQALDRAKTTVRGFMLDQALRRAARDGQLSLSYQPLVDIEQGRIIGAETLLRWHSPTLGDVAPSVFVPLLESSELVHEVGLWALNTACRQLTKWRRSGYPQLRLSVNVSAVQLRRPDLKVVTARTIEAHGLQPRDIELELTETAAMEDHTRNAKLLRELRDLGFGIALDDFGTGFSNLWNLHQLPVTKIKIDRAFVANIDTNPASQSICRAIVRLGDELRVEVLAEGVERIEEVQVLRRLGCNKFQGYFFAKPCGAEQFGLMLDDPIWLGRLLSDLTQIRSEPNRRLMA